MLTGTKKKIRRCIVHPAFFTLLFKGILLFIFLLMDTVPKSPKRWQTLQTHKKILQKFQLLFSQDSEKDVKITKTLGSLLKHHWQNVLFHFNL